LFIPPALRPRGAQVLTMLVHRLRRRMTGRVTSMTVAGIRTSLGLWPIDMPLALTLRPSADGAIRVGLRREAADDMP
jgi:predicted PurR-regulated permease PerM